jgi:hypothetical protein
VACKDFRFCCRRSAIRICHRSQHENSRPTPCSGDSQSQLAGAGALQFRTAGELAAAAHYRRGRPPIGAWCLGGTGSTKPSTKTATCATRSGTTSRESGWLVAERPTSSGPFTVTIGTSPARAIAGSRADMWTTGVSKKPRSLGALRIAFRQGSFSAFPSC